MPFCNVSIEHFEVITCVNCGLKFGMAKDFWSARLKNRGPNNPFYCPNGHKQWFTGETEVQKLKKENEQLWAVIEREREYRGAADRRTAAARGQVTRMKNRVGRGVCPCCNRTFENLSRHMTGKHPTFIAEDAS
jgi:hypothetical protein